MKPRRISEEIDGTGEFARSAEKKTFDLLAAEVGPQLEQAGISGTDDLRNDAKTNRFLSNLRLAAKYAPGLRFLGEGSSRYVYAMEGGRYALKGAKNYMGLIQNENEIAANLAGSADYRCFVRVLERDPSGVFIVEDLCRELPMSGWAPLIGVPLDRFVQIVRMVLERRKSSKGYSVADLLSECEKAGPAGAARLFRPESPTEPGYSLRDFAGVTSFMRNMVAASSGRPPSELWRSLFDIFRFYFDAGPGRLAIGELPWADQWGLCGSGAGTRVVLLDPGVDSDFAPQ